MLKQSLNNLKLYDCDYEGIYEECEKSIKYLYNLKENKNINKEET